MFLMHVDLKTPEYDALFQDAPLYRKSAVVQVRDAMPGEIVKTIMADGRVETVVTCKGGEPVVTNPGGEQYIPVNGWEDINRRYDSIGGGRYQAKGLIRSFLNPTGQEVTTTPPWGGEQNQGPDCMFAMAVREGAEDELTADRYFVGAQEHADTYKAVR